MSSTSGTQEAPLKDGLCIYVWGGGSELSTVKLIIGFPIVRKLWRTPGLVVLNHISAVKLWHNQHKLGKTNKEKIHRKLANNKNTWIKNGNNYKKVPHIIYS